MVKSEQLQADFCERAIWRGRLTHAKWKVHRVWACKGHAGDLEGAGQIR